MLETLDYQYADKSIEQHDFSKELLKHARLTRRKDLEIITRLSRARYFGLHHQDAEKAREYTSVGMPLESTRRVIGPFPATDVSPFHHPFPPEKND